MDFKTDLLVGNHTVRVVIVLEFEARGSEPEYWLAQCIDIDFIQGAGATPEDALQALRGCAIVQLFAIASIAFMTPGPWDYRKKYQTATKM